MVLDQKRRRAATFVGNLQQTSNQMDQKIAQDNDTNR